jgi:hypothetical protein
VKITTKKHKAKISDKGSRTIKLGKLDSAIVIFNSGGFETYIPNQPMDAALTESSAVAAMIMIALSEKKTFEILKKRFDGIMKGKIKPVPMRKKEKKS